MISTNLKTKYSVLNTGFIYKFQDSSIHLKTNVKLSNEEIETFIKSKMYSAIHNTNTIICTNLETHEKTEHHYNVIESDNASDDIVQLIA